MHYNGSIYGRPTIKKKEVVVTIPLWKKVLLKLDIPVYVITGIWVIWLYVNP